MSRNPFAVPDHARPAWDELHAQILATGPTPCAGADRNDWLGTAKQQARAARACFDCRALEACALYAVTAPEPEGVWGGMSPAERNRWSGIA